MCDTVPSMGYFLCFLRVGNRFVSGFGMFAEKDFVDICVGKTACMSVGMGVVRGN